MPVGLDIDLSTLLNSCIMEHNLFMLFANVGGSLIRPPPPPKQKSMPQSVLTVPDMIS